MTSFWRTYMLAWSAAVILFGVVLCGIAFSDTSGPMVAMLRIMGSGIDPAVNSSGRFGIALLGAVTIGWGVMTAATMRVAFNGGLLSARLWRALSAGVVAWYLIDTPLSVITGFWPNAIPNTLFAVAFLIGVLGSGALREQTA